MKAKKILLITSCAVMLASCKNEKKTETVADPAISKEAAVKDSIKKAELAELELIKQDSIESSQIKSYYVKKISGKPKYSDSKTKVTYSSMYQELAQIKELAGKEMWTKEKLAEMLSKYKTSAVGGIVNLEIERMTLDAANTEFFNVIIKDSNDTEVYREELESSVPNVPNSSHEWKNFASVVLPKRIKTPFYIYLVDQIGEVTYKYEVTSVKK